MPIHYKLHRVAQNTEGWVRPSEGRLGAAGVGKYVKQNGYGHEDWNFNFALSREGMMLGYTVARPARKLAKGTFRVVLATYHADDGWYAAGYYDQATYEIKPKRSPKTVLDQMASDVFQLAQQGSLSEEYQQMTQREIRTRLVQEGLGYAPWKISTDKVIVFKKPHKIPREVFAPGWQKMVTSYNISKEQFESIISNGSEICFAISGDRTFSEGARRLRMHYAAERNQGLTAAFKRALTTFACSICGFDFEQEYGPIGNRFIECHHTRPVSELDLDGDTTSVDDLIAVCSNCHRMLHRGEAVLTADELRLKRDKAKMGSRKR